MAERKDYIIIYKNKRDFTRTLEQFIRDCTPIKKDVDFWMEFYDSKVGAVTYIKPPVIERSDLVGKLTHVIKALVIGAILNLPEIVSEYKKALIAANLKFKGYNREETPDDAIKYTLKEIMKFIKENYLEDLESLVKYAEEEYNLYIN